VRWCLRVLKRDFTFCFINSNNVHTQSNLSHIYIVPSSLQKFCTWALFSSFAITWNIICIFFYRHLLICLNSVGFYNGVQIQRIKVDIILRKMLVPDYEIWEIGWARVCTSCITMHHATSVAQRTNSKSRPGGGRKEFTQTDTDVPELNSKAGHAFKVLMDHDASQFTKLTIVRCILHH
jgi:hypothetical protein